MSPIARIDVAGLRHGLELPELEPERNR